MFEHSESKIKDLAVALFWITTIFSWLIGFYYIYLFIIREIPTYLIVGSLTAVLGTVSAYVISLLMHGFGELILAAKETQNNTRKIQSNRTEAKGTKKVKFCAYCGADIQNDDYCCHECGELLE